MSEDVEGRELPPTMLQPVSFNDSPDQEAELRPSCGCADADRTYAELEAEFLRVSGELIVARNRVKALEENGAELLAQRDALHSAVEKVQADIFEQQKATGTTKDPWKLGVYAQASRTRCILRDALDASNESLGSVGSGECTSNSPGTPGGGS